MGPRRFEPDLAAPDGWPQLLESWRADPDSVLDLSRLGSKQDPVPAELLAGIPADNRIGDIDCRAAWLGPIAWDAAQFSAGADFSGARFTSRAEFRRAKFSAGADFSGARFTSRANFALAEFTGRALFRAAHFSSGPPAIRGPTHPGAAHFDHAVFSADADFSRLGGDLSQLNLQGARFVGDSHTLTVSWNEAAAKQLSVRLVNVRVEGDLIVQLGRCCVLDADGLTVRAPLSVIGDDPNGAGRLLRLIRADITAPFRIGRLIDISETTWGDHDLTTITVVDTSSLARHRPLRRLAERPLIPDRVAKRITEVKGRRRVLAGDRPKLDAGQLAVLERNYRDLRRQLEATGNHHVANDFYYGEMEARRRQLRWHSPYRWLLEIYRAISGYGTRAWSTVVAWLLLTLVATRLLLINGIDINTKGEQLSWATVWRFALEGSLSLFRPTTAPELSIVETLIMVALRILGPVLLALAAIAVRNQTKR